MHKISKQKKRKIKHLHSHTKKTRTIREKLFYFQMLKLDLTKKNFQMKYQTMRTAYTILEYKNISLLFIH